MSLFWSRNYSLVIWFAVTLGLIFSLGQLRIVAYNFGGGNKVSSVGVNHSNIIDLFDSSIVHEVFIAMADGDYDTMVTTYQETGEKDYFHADVTIDGVQIENVGIRLKGNITLRQAAGTGGIGGRGNGGPPGFGNIQPDEIQVKDVEAVREDVVAEEEAELTEEDFMTVVDKQFPFLLKFDEFVDGQTYQGSAEVAIRVGGMGNDPTLLAEPVSFYLHAEAGNIVPRSVYAYIESAGQDPFLYVITENIDESFIERNFSNADGVLYKAGNFVGFEYVGDDPTLYASKFEQKSSNNDDDLYYLIEFLKFVTESTEEEFERDLSKWLDIDSFIRMIATDTLIGNNDSFIGMGSNFYLYYDKNDEQFTMLAWDMNLSMGGMGGLAGRGGADGERILPENMQIPEDGDNQFGQRFGGFGGELPEGFDPANLPDFGGRNFAPPAGGFPEGEGGVPNGGGPGRNNTNLLKEKFFANEQFSELYNQELERLKDLFYNRGLAVNKVGELANIFTIFNAEMNVVDQSEYDAGVKKLKEFIQQQKNADEIQALSF